MEAMSKYGRLIKNVGAFTVSNVAIKLITFLLVPFYTYYLSAPEFGITDMLNTVTALVLPIVTGSIADAVLRYAIDDQSRANQFIRFGFLVTGASCILVALLLPLLDLDFFGGLGAYKGWFIAAYATMAIHNYLSIVARGLDKLRTMMAASILSSLVNIGTAMVAIAVLHLGVVGFFLSWVLGNTAGCLWYLLVGGLRHQCFGKFILSRNLLSLFAYSLPLVPNALFWWVSQSINRFFITGFIGIGASGLFAAASRIPGILNMVASIFQQAWNLSAFQEYRKKGRDVFFSTVFKVYQCGMAITTILLICSSKWIATLLFQKDFFRAWTLVPILLVAFYFSALNTFYGSVYTASMKTKYLFVTTVVGALVCVAGTWILLKLIGLPGAGIATALGNAVVWLMRLLDSRRFVTIDASRTVIVITIVLLLVSSFSICMDQAPYKLVAYGCLLAVVAVQVWQVWDILVHLLRRGRGDS